MNGVSLDVPPGQLQPETTQREEQTKNSARFLRDAGIPACAFNIARRLYVIALRLGWRAHVMLQSMFCS